MAAKAKLRNLKIDKLSLVDAGAQESARIELSKRRSLAEVQATPAAIAKRGRLTSDEDSHCHLYDDESLSGNTSYDYSNSGHSHPYVIEDGVVTIGMAAGHVHSVRTATDKAAPRGTTAQETAMTTDADRIKTLEAELAKAQTLASMTDAQRAHLAKLAPDAATVFLAKSASDRASEVSTLTEVIYKSATGEVFTKADDIRLVEYAKRADADRAENEQTKLEKRAGEVLKHIPRSAKVRAAMLKAFDGIPDEAVRKEAHEALITADNAMAADFVRKGLVPGAEVETGAAEELAKMAEARATKTGESIAKAKVWLLDNEPKALELKKRADSERKAAQRARA